MRLGLAARAGAPPPARENARAVSGLSLFFVFCACACARGAACGVYAAWGGVATRFICSLVGFGLRARRPARSLRLSCPPAEPGSGARGGRDGEGGARWAHWAKKRPAGPAARPAVHPQPRLNRGLKITNQNAAQNPRASHTSTDTSTRRQDPSPREHCRAWLRRVALRWQGAAYIYIYNTCMRSMGMGRRAAAARRTARVARAARDTRRVNIVGGRDSPLTSPHVPSSAGHMRGAVGCHLRA